jgi:acyl-CoA thioester hydrolase
MSLEQIERMRVAWVDTDAGGRIHFSNAFRWARRHVEAEFHKVLVFEDEFDVRLRVEAVGRTSITYAWTLERDGEICVSGHHTVVNVDREGKPEPLPDGVRAALSG